MAPNSVRQTQECEISQGRPHSTHLASRKVMVEAESALHLVNRAFRHIHQQGSFVTNPS
ncbi:protein of unknown function [Candidatus Nitrospira inopinata]|uniref:Uncharacterized protein n=1 Tax=Candidatus Nitrospira inopinata TaxID=1715989 RepID=A0A0S4KSX7_9BACT|nr:protein of unknown function [Candidatus Nitrospira inopinata]